MASHKQQYQFSWDMGVILKSVRFLLSSGEIQNIKGSLFFRFRRIRRQSSRTGAIPYMKFKTCPRALRKMISIMCFFFLQMTGADIPLLFSLQENNTSLKALCFLILVKSDAFQKWANPYTTDIPRA